MRDGVLLLQREVFGDTFDLAVADAAELPLDAVIPGMSGWTALPRDASQSQHAWALESHVVACSQYLEGLRRLVFIHCGQDTCHCCQAF